MQAVKTLLLRARAKLKRWLSWAKWMFLSLIQLVKAVFSAFRTCVFWVFWLVTLFALSFWAVEQAALFLAPTSKLGYFLKHSNLVDSSDGWKTASYEQMTVSARPHDCEWGSAPLGDKHCHYDAQVQTVRTTIATDGKTPLVSYDEGKTWSVNGWGATPSISVSWVKVEE